MCTSRQWHHYPHRRPRATPTTHRHTKLLTTVLKLVPPPGGRLELAATRSEEEERPAITHHCSTGEKEEEEKGEMGGWRRERGGGGGWEEKEMGEEELTPPKEVRAQREGEGEEVREMGRGGVEGTITYLQLTYRLALNDNLLATDNLLTLNDKKRFDIQTCNF